MPFKQSKPGSIFSTLKVEYKGREYTFMAEYVKFNNLKEYWHIHANGEILSLNYHVQTKVLAQDIVFGKVVPPDFLEALQKEFKDRGK